MTNHTESYETSRGQYSKRWEDLEITDNYLFCKIMSKPEFCKEMIERILGVKVGSVTLAAPERQIGGTFKSRGIRLDVEAVEENKIYDIEFQSVNKGDLEKRMRYYQAAMDVDTLNHNMNYKNLKDTWIVFICDFDMYGFDDPVYTIKAVIDSPGALETRKIFNDGSHKMFINLGSCAKIGDRKLRDFLLYLKTKKPQDGFTKEIDREVSFNRHNAEWRKEYMTFWQELQFEKDDIREEAREEKALEDAVLLVTKYKVTPETAAEDLKLSENAKKKLFEMQL